MTQFDRFEASLSEEGRYRLLVESITDYAIYMLDAAGIVSSWNPGAERFKGYKADEIIGLHFSCFYPPQDRAAGLPQKALDIARGEGKFEAEGWRLRKDGTTFWAYVVIDPIRTKDGEVVGFAKITRDLTERQKSQAALEIAREALFQSQKMEALGQLTGGVAHDFNNLLMAILGSLEIVQRHVAPDPKIDRMLRNAVKGAQRGVTLTERMLAFARRQQLEMEAIDVPALVQGMADLLERSIGPAVSVEVRFPLSLPKIRADANQLELALLNLAINARDAMPKGGSIILSAGVQALGEQSPIGLRSGRYVRLSVADSGDGMDAATLARAIDPFFTTKGVGKGTGLGLAMVHGMAEQSGGRLVLKSMRGEGTVAEIWLPVAELEIAAIQPPLPAIAAPAEPVIHKLKILAVDDDNLVLINTLAMLEELGHTTFDAHSGRQALEILRRQEIDLLITDQAMPQMTGVELVDTIRLEQPDLPVVLATGFAELPPEVAAKIARLDKPFGQNQLAAVIRQAVQHGGSARSL